MHRELIYYENGVPIARAYSQNNEHKNNGNLEALFEKLKEKIQQKEDGNHKWNWKDEIKKAYQESFPYL